ncbi:MAG: serine hydrolase domain-containing protein, partial [Bacteroidota bacterium]
GQPENANLYDARNEIRALNDAGISASAMDAFIEAQMDAVGMPGLSIAIINDAKIVYHRTFGYKNAQEQTPVDENTTFEAASMSKPILAVLAMHLVEAGKLDLDTPLHTYLPNYDLDYDERYRKITARMVLSHKTGMPNWRYENKGQYLNLRFDPGSQFSYSGEAFEYLGNVLAHIEGGTRKDLQQMIHERIFEPAGVQHGYYMWNAYLEENKASGHITGMANNRYQPQLPSMAGGLQINATDFAAFMISLLKGTGLSPATYDTLFSTQVRLPEDHVFVTNYDQHAWTLGFSEAPTPQGNIYGHGGNNGDFQAHFEFSREQNFGYVFLTNSEVGEQFNFVLRPFLRTGSEEASALYDTYEVVDRRISPYEDDTHKGVELNAFPDDGFAWLRVEGFSTGTIELDIKGANEPGASFVGVAFRGENENAFEGIYFRPFNFVAEGDRRNRMVQYHNLPDHSWRALRGEFPGVYEGQIPNAPDPDGWFHARIEVGEEEISVYVDDNPEPVLVVNSLNERKDGKIGFWVGSNSSGRFANLKITRD